MNPWAVQMGLKLKLSQNKFRNYRKFEQASESTGTEPLIFENI